jgi:predicted nucleic acid-binding protein
MNHVLAAARLRVVLDTNIYIAAFGHPKGRNAALQVVTADPTDDRILECAVDSKADLIVSNDHHLLNLGSYGDIPIVAGPDFRRTLGLR